MNQEFMNIVIVGHVDHGKSTIIGRLLADTHSLPEGKLEQVKHTCEVNSKPFEYAFLLDALKDEQSQGITIDSARVFFKTEKRHYIIIDAPGHIEFLKNMITGAARAEAALLVIDANEGVQENSRRHGYMLSMLGIKQIAVLVNKMDLVDYSQKKYDAIVEEYNAFLKDIGVEAVCYVPVSGRKGDMVADKKENLNWYQGKTVLDVLDSFQKEASIEGLPFRMPVQDIYKFTNFGDDRRIVAGTIDSGSISVGDEVIFYPSGKRSSVESIERFNAPEVSKIEAGQAVGLTLSEEIYIKRGEIAVNAREKLPESTTLMKTSLFWLSKQPMVSGKEYFLKLGTAKVPVKLEKIERIINASNLDCNDTQNSIQRHEVAECVLKLNQAIAFDVVDTLDVTSRFVIVDNYRIVGGGIIREALEDKQTHVRDSVMLRNYKWIKSHLSQQERAEKYSQKSAFVLVTGNKEGNRKEIAKALEQKLFYDGKFVYYLGFGSVIYGVDSDIKDKQEGHEEHLRRFSEVANILLDSGMILVATASELAQEDLEIIKTVIDSDKIETVWVGAQTTDIVFDQRIDEESTIDEAVDVLKKSLQEKGFIFKPW